MKYNLRKPCASCPYRTDIPAFLRRDRAIEIVDSLTMGGEFPCHKTLDYGHEPEYDEEGNEIDDGVRSTDKTAHCAGALIMLEHEGKPHQMMRIMERLRAYDRTKLDMDAPVFKTTRAFIEAQEE